MKKLNFKTCVITFALIFNLVGHIYSQDVDMNSTISLRLENVSMKEALEKISQISSIDFSYNSELVKNTDKISIEFKDQTIRNILDKIFENESIDYKVINNQVVIVKKVKSETKIELKLNKQEEVIENLEVTEEVNFVSEEVIKEDEDENLLASLLNKTPFSSSGANEDNSDRDTLNDEYNDELKVFHKDQDIFQLAFVFPVGTHGLQSKDKIFDVSFNILGGKVAGIKAFEFGGLYNIDGEDVSGIQIGGLMNLVGNDVNAVQVSGLVNINGGDVDGVQISGLANVVENDIDAVQIGGLANVNGGNVDGVQISGITNVSDGVVDGVQSAGIANIVGNSFNGLQTAGLVNIVGEEADGIQIAGIANFSDDMSGVQISGIANIADGDVDGLQISGIANITQKLDGMQIGFINICDSVKSGIPFGLVSIVSKNGFNQVELSSNEALSVIATYKMGVKQFYNSYSIGLGLYGDSFRWAVGVGFGTRFDMGSKLKSDIELIAYSINEDEIWTNKLNLLNQLKYTISTTSIISWGELFVGPTFSVMVSEYFNESDNSFGSGIAPWNTYDKTHGKTNVKMWPGISAGIRF